MRGNCLTVYLPLTSRVVIETVSHSSAQVRNRHNSNSLTSKLT